MPITIEVLKTSVNAEKLQEDIAAAISSKLINLRTGAGNVIVTVDQSTSTSEQTTVRNIIIDHDHTVLSSSQTEQQNIQSGVQSALSNAQLARQYPEEITSILNACIENLNVSDSLEILYTAVRAAVDASPNAVKNRFDRRVLFLYGTDVQNITLDAQKQNYVKSAWQLANSLITLLIISDTMNS